MIPVISADRKSCTIGDETLQLFQSVDYKSALEEKVGVGMIMEFKYAGFMQSDKGSVWMQVKDAVEEKKEWISLNVWLEHKAKGMFGIVKPQTEKANATTNTIPAEADDDLPF